MAFFDDESAAEPEVPADPPVTRPTWAGPPEDELGVTVPMTPQLVRGDDVVAAVTGVVAFSSGFRIALAVRGRSELPHRLMTHFLADPRPAGDLRYGLDLGAQGRVAPEGLRAALKALAGTGGDPLAAEPDGPIIMPAGGGGGGASYDHGFWVWPLPTDTVAVVLRWLDKGIEETPVELDAAAVREAASRSTKLW